MKFTYLLKNPDLIQWFAFDILYWPVTKRLLAIASFITGIMFLACLQKRRALLCLMAAQRYHPSDIYAHKVRSLLDELTSLYPFMMRDDVNLDIAVSRSIIIKMPTIHEGMISKGIIIITFTDTNKYFYFNVDIESLQKYFYVVLEPSSAGYCLPEIMFWAMYKEPVFVQATEVTDRIFLSQINKCFVPLHFGAGDWVNYNKFYSIGLEKLYDSVYVANYANVKRLHVYFKALNKIKKKGVDYKGAIVCAKWGGKKNTVNKLIEYYGVVDVLDKHESLNAAQINLVLNQSKCNLLLSLKEGSSRSIFESMLCNTPVILLKNNVGVNKTYINQSTGMLIGESDLANSLISMKSKYLEFKSREWAMENITPEITTAKLIEKIKEVDRDFVVNQGDIFIKTNEPEVTYMNNTPIVDRKHFTSEVFKLFQKGENISAFDSKLLSLERQFYGEANFKKI